MSDHNPTNLQPAPESDFIFNPVSRFIEKYTGNIPCAERLRVGKGYSSEDIPAPTQSHHAIAPSILRIPDHINGIPVAGIAEEAFMHCGAAEIILPDTVREIGAYAFRGAAITRLRLPRDLQTLHHHALYRCKLLTQLSLAPGNRFFRLDGNLLLDQYESEVITCIEGSFYGGAVVVVPEGVTTICPYAFSDKCFLAIVLPKSLKEIQEGAFQQAYVKYGLVLPYGLKQIAARAFDHFKSLRDCNCLLPSAVEIVDLAFAHCDIYAVLLSENLQKISKDAFHETSHMDDGKPILKILAPKGTLGEQFAQQNQLPWVDGSTTLAQLGEYKPELQHGERYSPESDFITDADEDPSNTCVSITGYKGKESKLYIPPIIGGKRVVGISFTAFAQNEHIMSVHIPEGVSFISAGAFQGCHILCSVRLPDSLSLIDDYAFSGCTALQNFHVKPHSVTYGKHVFSLCSMLPEEIRQRSPEGVAGFFRRLFKRD